MTTSPGKRRWCCFLSLVGLVVVAKPGAAHPRYRCEVLTVLAASMGFGFYTALGKKHIHQIGGLAQNSFSFLLGSGAECLILLAAGEPILNGITVHSMAVLLYVGIVVTSFGYMGAI